MDDIKHYAKVLKKNGTLLLSGLYTKDLTMIREEALKYDINYVSHHIKNDWIAATFLLK